MNLYSLLRFFLPLQNPLGFGLSDYVELGVAALGVAALLGRGRIARFMHTTAAHRVRAMAILFALPILLRLALLPHSPAPIPTTSDDFSYLLQGDTLAHFRLANPTHPMHRFFETVFVLQEPRYASIYPLGPGIALAAAQLLFHNPWIAVLPASGALAALTYWMLLAWTEPVPALFGGLYAAIQFGPLNQWTNTFWGGALSACAGCLVFGAIPRLWRFPRTRDATLLGLGCGIQILTRPFESVLLAVAIALPVIAIFRRSPRRIATVTVLAVSPAFALTLAQNRAVTGNWFTLPYMLSRYEYGVPANFTFQPNAQPHRALNREQQVDYQAQSDVHGYTPETLGTYVRRLIDRVRFLRFFLMPPLLVASIFALPDLRLRRFRWAAASVAVFALGTNIYPYFYPQYVAAVTCLLILMAIRGWQRLSRLHVRGFAVGADAARILSVVCVAWFTFWYGIHLFGNDALFGVLERFESWDFVNFGDAESRRAMDRQLSQAPGAQLVFVRLGPRHLLREWIHNDADIDRSRVVWALDLGPEEDAKLLAYYPKRTAWLAEPDAVPPRLTAYESARLQ
jgi:hypothetical protein